MTIHPVPKPPKRPKKPKTRVKRYNTKRRGRAFPKRRDEKYLAWIRTHPCVACLATGFRQGYRTEAAHVTTRGAGGADKGNTVPLCTSHHMEQHHVGLRAFQERYGLDLRALCTQLAQQYDHEEGNR